MSERNPAEDEKTVLAEKSPPTGAYLQMLNPGETVTVTGKVLDANDSHHV